MATVDEVLARALTGPLTPIEWKADKGAVVVADDDDEDVAEPWRRSPGPIVDRPVPTPPAALPHLRS